MWGPPEVLKPYLTVTAHCVSAETHPDQDTRLELARCHPEWDGILLLPTAPLLHQMSAMPAPSYKGCPWMQLQWPFVDMNPFRNQHRALKVISYTYCLWVVAWRTSSLLGIWLFNPPVAKMVGTHASRLSASMNPYEAFPGPSYPNCPSSGLTPFVLL